MDLDLGQPTVKGPPDGFTGGVDRPRRPGAAITRHVIYTASEWHWGRKGPATRTFRVVGTGVDPVTSRFSGARSAN
jgi:hypothetical protein